jgi:hypothetical protein
MFEGGSCHVVDVLVGSRPAGRFVEEELGFWIRSLS